MGVAADLAPEALAEALAGRALRTYPALLSTEADALAWARAGAPEGAVVVADHQISPRGRGGLVWRPRPGASLAFSLVLRPRLGAEREGWLYTVATCALADVLGEQTTIAWPDEVWRGGARAGAVGVRAQLGPGAVEWAVVSVLVEEAQPPRGPLLARLAEAIEQGCRLPSATVLAGYEPRCTTIGRRVRARLSHLGPSGAKVAGLAVRTLDDGALVVETAGGRRVAVRPQSLRLLEDAGDDAQAEPAPGG